jgi:N-hydroxyarylamine O-acetyltransferase
VERFYEKIVMENRGGFCYEMNGLFQEMLQLLKFKSYFISCNVYIPPANCFAADFGHVAIIVDLDELYLADVGFGDAFIEPLKIVFDTPQQQYGTYYKFSPIAKEEIVLEKSFDGVSYVPMFKFTLKERRLEEFSEMCAFHQQSPLAPFSKGRLVSKPTLNGRITLTEKGLFETKGGKRKEIMINEEKEFYSLLQTYFGMNLSRILTVV